jgi:hypothetical protein
MGDIKKEMSSFYPGAIRNIAKHSIDIFGISYGYCTTRLTG